MNKALKTVGAVHTHTHTHGTLLNVNIFLACNKLVAGSFLSTHNLIYNG